MRTMPAVYAYTCLRTYTCRHLLSTLRPRYVYKTTFDVCTPLQKNHRGSPMCLLYEVHHKLYLRYLQLTFLGSAPSADPCACRNLPHSRASVTCRSTLICTSTSSSMPTPSLSKTWVKLVLMSSSSKGLKPYKSTELKRSKQRQLLHIFKVTITVTNLSYNLFACINYIVT